MHKNYMPFNICHIDFMQMVIHLGSAALIYFLCKVTPYKNVFMRPLHEHKVAFCHIENSI